MHTKLCKARPNNLLVISSKSSYSELIRKIILFVFFILYIILSMLLSHWFVIICFQFVSCTLPMILNPGCTLKSTGVFFKKFKCPDIPSSNFDFTVLRWKLGVTIFKTISGINDIWFILGAYPSSFLILKSRKKVVLIAFEYVD